MFAVLVKMGNASPIEIIWTLLGLVGMVISWGNMKYSWLDIQALKAMNGRNLGRFQQMRVIAYGHFRNDAFRFCKHLTVCMIGILAMVFPSPHEAPSVSPVGLIVTGGLFTIVVLMVLASILDRMQRNAMEEISIARESYSAKEGKGETHG